MTIEATLYIAMNLTSKKKIKRFYQITNNNINFIRAWHGHKKEDKFLLVQKGVFKICAVKIDNWKNPSKTLSVKEFVINANSPKILYIPGGMHMVHKI